MFKKNSPMFKSALTARQKEVLDFIRRCIRKRGYGPTVRELGDALHIKSSNGVVGHLKALQRKGFIHRDANLSRSIRLMEPIEKHKMEVPSTKILKQGKIFEISVQKELNEFHEKIRFQQENGFQIQVMNDWFSGEYSLKKGEVLFARKARNAALNETAILLDEEGNFQLARCVEKEEKEGTELRNGSRKFENAYSGIEGILVAVMRFENF